VLQAAAGHLRHVTVFGDDDPTSDGTCVRDSIHVEDLAHAQLLALQSAAARTAPTSTTLDVAGRASRSGR
jgi:UDP-glucose 4-epimerase